MKLTNAIKRSLFYGLILLISTTAFYYLKLSIKGETAYKAFFAVALVSGSIQSINFLVIRKISEIQKIQNIGFWARWRLRLRVEPRRTTAFSRAITGIVTALGSGAFSAWMNILDQTNVPYWGLGLATGLAIVSIFMLFLTIYEFSVVSKLETEISWKAENTDQKKNALKSIRGDDKKI